LNPGLLGMGSSIEYQTLWKIPFRFLSFRKKDYKSVLFQFLSHFRSKLSFHAVIPVWQTMHLEKEKCIWERESRRISNVNRDERTSSGVNFLRMVSSQFPTFPNMLANIKLENRAKLNLIPIAWTCFVFRSSAFSFLLSQPVYVPPASFQGNTHTHKQTHTPRLELDFLLV